ncbi:MAG: TetR/AcrR family transcriptional regulator [Solirubrobacteraceae bacterium]
MTEQEKTAESRAARTRRRATTAERERRVGTDPAQKMIRKTRELIREHGIAAANVRDIARARGQSVAAPLWYFGSKGRLLVEVLRFEHDERIAVLRARVEPASTREELVEAVHGTLRAFLDERALRGSHELLAEITRLAIDDEDVAGRRGDIRREHRDVLARLLGDKQREGVVVLSGHATVVAAILISLAQGFAVEITSDRGWKPQEAITAARLVIEALLREPAPPG